MNKLAIYGGEPVRKKKIPLCMPWFGPEEIKNAAQVIASGKVGGNGKFGRKCEEILSVRLKSKYALLTTSCTSALELAIMALGIGAGDEVIAPSFSFVSTANAVVRQGARIRFVDIEPFTFNIDAGLIEKNITKKTKAIIVVHYGGQSAEMDKIAKIAQKYNLKIIEDAAHAIGAKYKNKFLGTIGDIGCFSFHETKNLSCGEGGALLTNSPKIAKKVEIMREKGTNRSKFLRGEVDKYTWVDIGSSYVISDILAAIILPQLQKMDKINNLRTKNAMYLYSKLYKYQNKITLPHLDNNNNRKSNWHIFSIRVPSKKRDQIIAALNAEGISASFHFLPLHNSPFMKKFFYKKGAMLPVTQVTSDTLIRLPLYAQMKKSDLDDIIAAVKKTITHLL